MTADPDAQRARRAVRIGGRYDVVKHIATGGMGAVYKALDTETGKVVALKVLTPDLATRPNVLARFYQEARSAAKLQHENIIAIYDFGEDEETETHYLALEFVDGTDLQQYLDRKGPLQPEESLPLLLQALRALDHAHQQGIVHRDIKPSNFLLTEHNGRTIVKLADMGLARQMNDAEFRLTRAGHTVGTIDYMSPEQARDSGNADSRSDIYSLGCTWYHMLAGNPPFAEGSLTERLFKHMQAEPPDIAPLNPRVSARVMGVLRRMLAKRPEDRYQSPADLLKELDKLMRSPAAAPDRPSPAPAEKEVAPKPAARPTEVSSGRSTASERRSPVANVPLGAAPTPAQQLAAAGQFQRAEEVILSGNYEYGFRLLLTCCTLDPASLLYRQTLRQAQKSRFENSLHGSKLAWLTTLGSKAKLKAAKRAGKFLKALEHGEAVLIRNPWDLGTQLDMAGAAESLGLLNVAIWVLEQAQDKHARSVALCRALARLYEKRRDLAEAAAMWESVRELAPDDKEARQKVNDLAANDTIARSLRKVGQHRYGRKAGRS